MDVISVESCVQAVIGAYRDATRLMQRLRDKQKGTENEIPESQTKELDDSLSLGCLAIQSQYDHDVKRFGETYARGDAIAREQMKDILITIQQAIVSHLREVYMDDAVLNLSSLKETSDDSRVNATVCLGQLYQRMSTATAAVKQLSRTYSEGPDNAPPPALSLAYSSSRSTHSSYEPSLPSYSTIGGIGGRRTPVSHSRKPSGHKDPKRRTSMTSAVSYSSEPEPPKNIASAEEFLPALRFSRPGEYSYAVADTESTSNHLTPEEDPVQSPSSVPPSEPHWSRQPSYMNEEQSQFSPDTSNLGPLSPPLDLSRNHSHENVLGQKASSYGNYGTPNLPDDGLATHGSAASDDRGTMPSTCETEQRGSKSPATRKPVPMPQIADYSTLEHVSYLETRSRPPVSYATQQVHEPQQNPQPPTPQWSIPDAASMRGSTDAMHYPHGPDDVGESKPLPPKPMSIHSANSTGHSIGSKFSVSAIRKALPPGLTEKKKQPTSSSHQPSSPTRSRVATVSSGVVSIPGVPPSISSQSTTQSVPLEPQLQVPNSLLNLPSESNLSNFCKGAVRLQLNTRKKGLSLEHRRSATSDGPAGDYWKCTKCTFAGPAVVSTALPSGGRGAAKREKSFDTRVRVSETGIKYRWVFLAKCHNHGRNPDGPSTSSKKDEVHGIFGCVFCCSEGAARGWVDNDGGVNTKLMTLGSFDGKKIQPCPVQGSSAPLFPDLKSFMAHLEMHRRPEGMPGLVVAEMMNCVVGRKADDSEDFDLNLPPL